MYYFDYAATTPTHPDAAHVLRTLSEKCYGNTNSLHDIGGEAQNMLLLCRREFANLLGVSPEGIYFTSGGTESNLLAIISLAKANRHRGMHIVTTAGEHPSVDSALQYLEQEGFTFTVVPFGKNGIVDLVKFEEAIQENTILATVQHVNPEIGTIQPLEQIANLLKVRSILLHTDCVQSFGKMDLKPIAELVDSLTVSSHKVYGPKGVGAAYIHPRHRLVPVFPGLVHESGFRGGTVNVPGIAAFTTAANRVENNRLELAPYWKLRKVFYDKMNLYKDHCTFYGSTDPNLQLPHIIGFGVKRREGQFTMLELNRDGFAISTGSACKVGQQHASKAMLAMNIDVQQAKEFVRISFGESSTIESVNLLTDHIIQIVKDSNPAIVVN